VDFTFSSRDFSGASVVISAKAFPILQRVPAVIGLYFFSAIVFLFIANLSVSPTFMILF
jgi:hypothetical protein